MMVVVPVVRSQRPDISSREIRVDLALGRGPDAVAPHWANVAKLHS
jgi:hypothetical protein